MFTDANVKQEASTVDSWRPLLLHKNYANEGVDPGLVTDQTHYNASISANPKQGTIRANAFKGRLQGTADNAIELNKITLGSNANTHTGYYKQFATAKVTKAWESFGGVFVISDQEANSICGIVRIKARTSSSYDIGVPTIEWLVLNKLEMANNIIAVKNAAGDFTYYIKAFTNYNTYQIACL
jgi:hypothetical protein